MPNTAAKFKSTHACPNCRGELVHVPLHGRTSLRCPQGHGQALAGTTLRSWLVPEFREDFERALSGGKPARRGCPHCKQNLLLSRFHGVLLEQCRPCAIVWIHDAVLERLPLRHVRERGRSEGSGSLSLGVHKSLSPLEGVRRDPAVFPFATLGLLAAFCLATIAYLWSGGNEIFVCYPQVPLREFGLPLFLSLFAHASLAHLAGNAYFLFLAGSVLEAGLGWRRYLELFFLCGLAGAAGAAFVSPDGGLGASGAIAGLVTALVATQPRALYVLQPASWFLGVPVLPFLFTFSLRVPLWLWAFVWFGFDLWGATQQLGGRATDGIGHGAHLGGAVAGAILACLPYFRTRDSESPQLAR
jgi:membrane associated rhomboid family serine protease